MLIYPFGGEKTLQKQAYENYTNFEQKFHIIALTL